MTSQEINEVIAKRTNQNARKHGLYGSIVYKAWEAIKQRCFNPRCANFHRYGGRGISMWSGWVDSPEEFAHYVLWLEHCGEPGRSIDRIDNNAGYEPGNIRWATIEEQNQNQSSSSFSPSKVRWARLLEEILPRKDIVNLLDVGYSNLGAVLRGETWTNVR